MLEIRTAKSGQPTARVDGVQLHSPYDPRSEARRFVDQTLLSQNPSIILLLGEGLGYVFEELRRDHPLARLIVVFYDEALFKAFSPSIAPHSVWHPGSGETVLGFLRSQIHELEAEGLATVEWPPSARIYAQQSLEVNRALQQLLREIRGTLVTTSAAGRLCFTNSLFNFLFIDEIHQQPRISEIAPVTVIAASGPTLQQASDFLYRHRQQIILWALPSALDFLMSCGLMPDTVILTDPGYYAFTHLQCAVGRSLHLTMPLSAARGSWRIGARVSLLNQNTPYEQALLKNAGTAAPIVPAHGTVSATALLLSLQYQQGPVILAGLDFCYRDIVSHVRPNNFETWLLPKTSLLQPLHHRLFALAAETSSASKEAMRRNLALDTYAGWFKEMNQAGTSQAYRIRRLHPSAIALPGIEEISERQLAGLLRSENHKLRTNPRPEPEKVHGYPGPDRRRKILQQVLKHWLNGAEKAIAGLRTEGSFDHLLNDAETLNLLYLCNAAQFSEARRTLRIQGRPAGLAKSLTLLDKHREFLRDLLGKFSEQP